MANDKMTLTVIIPMGLGARIDAAARGAKRTRADFVRLLLEANFPADGVPPDQTKKGHK